MKKIGQKLTFLRNKCGSAALEFALVLPIFILIISGIFELSMFLLINNKLIRVTGTMSNIISTQNITAAQLNAILNTADSIFSPINFTNNGQIVVSQIYNNGLTNLPNNMLISWQYKLGSITSEIGAPNTMPANLPGGYTVVNSENAIVTEVFYNYKPYIFTGIIPSRTLYKIIIYPPREGNMKTLLP